MDLLRNKKQNLVKVQKRQIADLLQQQKDESARIKVENIIREDYQVESYDILQLFCDLLQTRIQLIAESKYVKIFFNQFTILVEPAHTT